MEATLLFLQISLPLAIALSVATFLRPVTRRLLRDLCGTEDRAEFWTRVLVVLWVLVPMALVLCWDFGELWRHDPYGALRRVIALTLAGLALSVAYVSARIGRYVPAPGVAEARP
jgi:hypothetical protein